MRLPLCSAVELASLVILIMSLASDANAGSGRNSGVYSTSMMTVMRERQQKELADYESAKRRASDRRPLPDRRDQNQTKPIGPQN